MSCNWLEMLTAGWDVSDTIAFCALLLAGWAGWSAHRSAVEATRANHAARYYERRMVFDAFLDLNMHMQIKGQRADLHVVSQFYRHVFTAFFCLDKALAEKLKTYFDACHAVADNARTTEGFAVLPDDIQKQLRWIQHASTSLLDELEMAVAVP